MFKRILVPLDGTDSDDDSIHLAAHLAQPSMESASTAARIVLVRVEPDNASEDTVVVDQGRLEAQAQELRAQGIDAYALIEFDRPADGIATTARYQHSDVIVMAPRHRSNALDALFHPSVTARLFAHSPAPLLIWPTPAPDTVPDQTEESRAHPLLQSTPSMVIVPLDGSALAERALADAVALAQEYNRTVALLRVAPRVSLLAAGADTLLLEADAQHEENRKALHYLKQVRRDLSHETALVVQTVLRVGDPAREMVRFAQAHPDSLIVMSTHGRGGLERLLAGSVTTQVVRAAPVPILIVPARPEHESDGIKHADTSETRRHRSAGARAQ